VQRFYDFSYPDVRDIREQTRTLSGLTGFDGGPMMVRDASGSRRHMISYVTGDFFTGARRAGRGRTRSWKDDENPAAASTIVLSDHLWRDDTGEIPPSSARRCISMVSRSSSSASRCLSSLGHAHASDGCVDFVHRNGITKWRSELCS
jgi:hypothetical protein